MACRSITPHALQAEAEVYVTVGQLVSKTAACFAAFLHPHYTLCLAADAYLLLAGPAVFISSA